MGSDAAVAAFRVAFAKAAGTPPLADDEATAVLALTREVAHGAERRLAPLAAYAAGLAIGAATDPVERAAQVRAITEAARPLLSVDPPAG